MKAPKQHQKQRVRNQNHSNLLNFYQQNITAADGDRCSMYPSCSEFSKRAVEKLGFLRGVLLSIDRLTRCGNDSHFYPQVKVDRIFRSFDPIEAKY